MLEGEPNPNQCLSLVLLNEFNYLSWSRAVTIDLGGRFKPGYVNGYTKPLESSSLAYEARQCKDQLVMSWLLNFMKNYIAEIFSTQNLRTMGSCERDVWKSKQFNLYFSNQ